MYPRERAACQQHSLYWLTVKCGWVSSNSIFQKSNFPVGKYWGYMCFKAKSFKVEVNHSSVTETDQKQRLEFTPQSVMKLAFIVKKCGVWKMKKMSLRRVWNMSWVTHGDGVGGTPPPLGFPHIWKLHATKFEHSRENNLDETRAQTGLLRSK